MPNLMKLYYFDTEGYGEVSRLIFKFANVPFEDVRIPKTDWPAMKNEPRFLTQQIPILELANGKILGESKAIQYYLGKLYGFMGKDVFEDAKIQQYVFGLDDNGGAGKAIMLETDLAKKAELAKAFYVNVVVNILQNYTKFLNENGNNGHLVGDKLTVADLALYQALKTFMLFNIPIENEFPILSQFLVNMKEKVAKLSHA
uniref:Glutathione transferase n=1 Tax=Rhabditophanes sp. KR3021 TaxID=114890 RepID=A0AC35TV87_9BILA